MVVADAAGTLLYCVEQQAKTADAAEDLAAACNARATAASFTAYRIEPGSPYDAARRSAAPATTTNTREE